MFLNSSVKNEQILVIFGTRRILKKRHARWL